MEEVVEQDRDGIAPDIRSFYGISIFTGLVVALFTGWFTVWLTWNIGIEFLSFKSFGGYTNDLKYIWDGLLSYFLWPDSGSKWQFYMSQLQQKGAVGSFYVHLVIPIVLAITFGGFSGSWIHRKTKPAIRHIRGFQYHRDIKEATKRLAKICKLETKGEMPSLFQRFAKFYKRDTTIETSSTSFIHPKIPISKQRDHQGMILVSAMGGGKSQILTHYLDQIIPLGHRMMMHDEKGELTAWLPVDDDDFVLIGPWDKRSAKWNIARDIQNKGDARMVSEFYIKDSGRDPMWPHAARQVLTGILNHALTTKPGKWGFGDVVGALRKEPKDLARLINAFAPEAKYTIDNLAKQEGLTGEGVMINLTSYLSPFYDLAEIWEEPGGFSVREWLEDDYQGPKIVVLQNSGEYKPLAQAVNASILTLGATKICDPQFPEWRSRNEDYRIYFPLDEVLGLDKLPCLETLISKGRSKGVRLALAFQNISQVVKMYGKEVADTWWTQLGTKFIGRAEVGDTAKWFSENILGLKKIQRPTQSVSRDQDGRLNTNRGWETLQEPVMYPNEFSRDLFSNDKKRTFTGLLMGTGWPDVYRLRWHSRKMIERRKQSVPAEWVKPIKEGHRYIKDGEYVMIGDQYQSGDEWIPLDENEYREWIGISMIYNKSKYGPIRRAVPHNTEDAFKSSMIRQEFWQEREQELENQKEREKEEKLIEKEREKEEKRVQREREKEEKRVQREREKEEKRVQGEREKEENRELKEKEKKKEQHKKFILKRNSESKTESKHTDTKTVAQRQQILVEIREVLEISGVFIFDQKFDLKAKQFVSGKLSEDAFRDFISDRNYELREGAK